jgi:hypothetical protein
LAQISPLSVTWDDDTAAPESATRPLR